MGLEKKHEELLIASARAGNSDHDGSMYCKCKVAVRLRATEERDRAAAPPAETTRDQERRLKGEALEECDRLRSQLHVAEKRVAELEDALARAEARRG